MTYELPKFRPPDFTMEKYKNLQNVKVEEVKKAGVAPKGFYLTSHMPTYYKVNGKWIIPPRSSLNCVAIVDGKEIIIKELRDLEPGEKVIMGKKDDGSLGILKYPQGFPKSVVHLGGSAVETSHSEDYRFLYKLLKHEKENNGYIVWVLGPSVVFDHDTRIGLSRLAENGYVDSLLGGNAMATHDLEGGYLGTALGQNIYTQVSVPMGHYNHLDLLNEVRRAGSIDEFIAQGHVKDGFIKTLKKLDVPITLAGSIRDDGPLPEVTHCVSDSLNEAKKETDKATLIICLATMLHSVSNANLASSYRIDDEGNILPVYFYSIDVTENVCNKVIAARENIAVRTLVTNVQDFVVNVERAIIPDTVSEKDQVSVNVGEYVEIEKTKRDEKQISRELN